MLCRTQKIFTYSQARCFYYVARFLTNKFTKFEKLWVDQKELSNQLVDQQISDVNLLTILILSNIETPVNFLKLNTILSLSVLIFLWYSTYIHYMFGRFYYVYNVKVSIPFIQIIQFSYPLKASSFFCHILIDNCSLFIMFHNSTFRCFMDFINYLDKFGLTLRGIKWFLFYNLQETFLIFTRNNKKLFDLLMYFATLAL